MITRSQSKPIAHHPEVIQGRGRDRTPEEPAFFNEKTFQRQVTLWLKWKMRKSVRRMGLASKANQYQILQTYS